MTMSFNSQTTFRSLFACPYLQRIFALIYTRRKRHLCIENALQFSFQFGLYQLEAFYLECQVSNVTLRTVKL